jgi:MFS family permease
MPTAPQIIRTYLVLLLGNTLAASLIWGINTIFLLDAGLSNLEAFAANAFFTAGMVLFEVPTGIVADGVGRRASYLAGTLTLAASTLLYLLLWRVEAAFWAWAVVSILIGLGFTFFSGAVEAWLVDGLGATGFTGELDSVFARGQIVSGVAMLVGSVAGGFIAEQSSLGVPFVLRGLILIVMFAVAFRLMRDIGFTPERGGRPFAEMRRIAAASIDYGWRVASVKWLMLEALFTGGVGIYAFYALQPYLLELWGDPHAYQIAGWWRRSSPAHRSSAGSRRPGSAATSAAARRPARDGGARFVHARADRPRRQLLGRGRTDRRLGLAVRGLAADSADLPERPDPVAATRDDPLVRLDDGLGRRRLGPAGARSGGGRLGICALLPARRGHLDARAAVPGALEAPARSPRTSSS